MSDGRSAVLEGRPAQARSAANAPALDLHGGIRTPTGRGCPRWNANRALRSSHGELVAGRCRATNLCSYCAKLAAVENSELLWLDALHGLAPTMWLVLTTPSPVAEPRAFYADRKKLILALRRRWPELEWAALVEFTTGYGPRSGGRRRPHWNLFLKGVPDDLVHEVAAIVTAIWCRRQKASPDAQSVTVVKDVAGLIRYVALHFQKESQAPPHGWKGHRFLKSRGYLWTDTPTARAAARASLAHKREIHKATQRGLDARAAELVAAEAAQRASETTWTFVSLGGEGDTIGAKARRSMRAARARDPTGVRLLREAHRLMDEGAV